MINKLHIENFRAIKHLELDGFKRINVFSGKNNSGKTSILEALLILLKMDKTGKVLSLIHGLRGYQIPKSEHLDTLFYGQNKLSDLNLTFTDYCTRYAPNTFKKASLYSKSGSFRMEHIVITSELEGDWESKTEEAKEIDELVFNFDLMSNYDKAAEFFASILINDQLLMKGTAERVRKLILEKKQADLIKVLQQIDPQIVDIYADENEVSLDIGLERFISANVAGDGLKKLISIISAIYINKGGVVLIDEIENGLHYSAQQKLWEAIIIAAQTFDVQIFATTHSYESLQALNVVLHQENNKDKDLVSFTRLDKKGEDTKAYMVHQELFHTAIESQLEIR